MAITPRTALVADEIPQAAPTVPVVTQGLKTRSLYVALCVLSATLPQVGDPATQLLELARSMQSDGSTTYVDLYVPSDVCTQDHKDLAHQMPGDVSLPPWRLTSYKTLLDLQEQVARQLVRLAKPHRAEKAGELGD
jgi:hypothetical protein